MTTTTRITSATLSTFVALLLATCQPMQARAQGSARSMDFDLSIRSAGMGGASNAVFWGDEVNHWGNPALLGQVLGMRYEWTRTQLVPGLADDVHITSGVLKVGAGGVGLVLSGRPYGLGRVFLDYGQSEWRDDQGNLIGTFSSYEQVDSWGYGVNVVQVAEGLLGANDGPSGRWSRYGDISLGQNFKQVQMVLGPGFGGSARTAARDFGVLVRVTPVNHLDAPDRFPWRLDVAHGWSVLSYNDDAIISFINEDLASPVSRHRRNGTALRLAVNAPAMRPSPGASELTRTVLAGFTPLLSLSVSADRAGIGAGDRVDYKTMGVGFEASLANVLAVRTGRYLDRAGDIAGSTLGWSVGLPFGSLLGFRYEEASFPQASGLDHVHRRAFAAWTDPIAVWRTFGSTR